VTARVSDLATEVSVDAQSWKFELDSRHGTASVQLGGQRFTLRVQSWREKRILARFAHLGEAFLEDQFLRLCLSAGEAPPQAGPEREALIALARWLNAPGGTPGLPLDQHLLANVTLQICQAIHTAPQTFDGLDAADVELFWQAVRAGTPVVAESQAANRILVMADATAADAGPRAAAPASAPVLRTDNELPGVRTAPGVPGPEAAREPVPAGESAPSAHAAGLHPAGDRGKPTSRAIPAVATPPRPEQQSEAPQAPSGTGRFRVLLDARVDRPQQHRSMPGQAAPHAGDKAPAVLLAAKAAPALLDTRRSDPEPAAWLQPPGTSERAHPLLSAFALDRSARGGVRTEPGPDSGDNGRPRAWPAQTSPQPSAGGDSIFEELAARLEQAAAEQGIDLET
jgi:hypothetical protein